MLYNIKKCRSGIFRNVLLRFSCLPSADTKQKGFSYFYMAHIINDLFEVKYLQWSQNHKPFNFWSFYLEKWKKWYSVSPTVSKNCSSDRVKKWRSLFRTIYSNIEESRQCLKQNAF